MGPLNYILKYISLFSYVYVSVYASEFFVRMGAKSEQTLDPLELKIEELM